MRIKIGQRFRDYTGVPYVVKSYKNSVIEFEVDGQHIEKYTKSEFVSEINGNRFHEDLSPVKKEISDEDIEKASWKYEPRNKFDAAFIREAFMKGAEWYKEQLKTK